MCLQNRAQLCRLLKRQVRHDERADTGGKRAFGQRLVTEREQGVQIRHHDQRRIDFIFGHIELLEDPRQAHALPQSLEAGALNRHAVRHRIGERDAELDDIAGASNLFQRFDKRGRIGIARGNEWHQADASGIVGGAQRSADSFVCRH